MFIKYQIKDVDFSLDLDLEESEFEVDPDTDIVLREGIINSSQINHIEVIEERNGLMIYLTNQVLQVRFADKCEATIAYLSFIEALQHIGTNHEFIKLTVIPNF